MKINELSYVALVTRDMKKAVTILGDVLELARTDVSAGTDTSVPVFSVGRTAIALFEPGHSYVDGEVKPGVHHVAFAVDSATQAAKSLASAGFKLLDGGSRPGLQGRDRIGIDPTSTSGVKLFLQEPLDIARSRSESVERIDHLGIACADNRRAVDVFCNKLGLAVESQQTDMETQIAIESFTSDKYGAVYHSRSPEIVGGLRVAFITAGDLELEFLQNFDANQAGHVQHGTSGNTRQDQGAITRFIASRGEGLHHVAFKTPDINAILKKLGDRGFETIDCNGRPGSRRALIGFVQPKSMGGVLIHFVQR